MTDFDKRFDEAKDGHAKTRYDTYRILYPEQKETTNRVEMGFKLGANWCREPLKVAVEALKFVSMPITTRKENLTVDKLLKTINEDDTRAREALTTIEKFLSGGGE